MFTYIYTYIYIHISIYIYIYIYIFFFVSDDINIVRDFTTCLDFASNTDTMSFFLVYNSDNDSSC